MSAAYLFQNVLFLHAAESNFWSDRLKARNAQLKARGENVPNDAALFARLPSQMAETLPVSRVPAAALLKEKYRAVRATQPVTEMKRGFELRG